MVSATIVNDPLYARVRHAGETLRRIERGDAPNERGQKTLWHQGKEQTELLSWEEGTGLISRQEMFFVGLAVDFRHGFGVRTGSLDQKKAGSAHPSADLVVFDNRASQRVLELAAVLLRQAARDFYTQHLLQQVHETLDAMTFEDRTNIVTPDRWRKKVRRATDRLTKMSNKRGAVLAAYVAAGVLLGAAVAGVALALLMP